MSAPDYPGRRSAVIAIAGCSGSGKTCLAEALARRLHGVHFPIDNYYRDLSHVPPAERARTNFDDPATIESALLAEHVAALARGEAIERPLYDFATHTRIAGRTERMEAGALVIVEGIFALHYEELLPLYQLRVYVDASNEICFKRRLLRDVTERGRTVESVHEQYELTVRPSSWTWVRPSEGNADLAVRGMDALEQNVERVIREMHQRAIDIGFPY